jgi:hypothetical protein
MRTTGGMPVMLLDCGGADEGRPAPSLRGGCHRRSAGPLSGRRCALAGYVAASIMEWPGLACDDAILKTLRTITDFYRVKLSGGAAGARDKIQTIERAITTFEDGKTLRAKTVAHHHGLRQRH